MKSQPLSGIRVLEIGAYISTPYAGVILSSLGAEVVKVEPIEGDPFRRGMDNKNAYFKQYNSGKKSIAINLKSPEGLSLIKTLLPSFDVVMENMRPGKMTSLGLSEEVCLAINSSLIYGSVSGFGADGPWAKRPAYDTIGQSISGVYSILNDANNKQLTGTCIADLITGVSSAMGIITALFGRERSCDHLGGRIETSLLESMSLLTIDALTQAFDTGVDPERDSRHPQAQNFCLETADGKNLTIHLSVSQKFWTSLAHLIGRPDLITNPHFSDYETRILRPHYEEIVQILKTEFLKHSLEEWEVLLSAADIPYAPLLSMHEVANHEQTNWLELLGPQVGQIPMQRLPWTFDGVRPPRSNHPAHVGEHTHEILSSIYSDEKIKALAEQGHIKIYENMEP
ncbi:MAG: CaiB/BaiF CoA-transferase family protein [Pelistega sp.]|nr:CaiB/BaiF CoA-transferase family protein [Pelistega sp.]